MGEVSHIIRGKGLTAQVRVHVAQTAQTIRCHARTPKIGEKDALVISHHHIFDNAFAIDQHANLTVDLQRQLTEIPRQFLRHNLLRRHLATIDMLEPVNLIGLQTRHVAFYSLNRRSPRRDDFCSGREYKLHYTAFLPRTLGYSLAPGAVHGSSAAWQRGLP